MWNKISHIILRYRIWVIALLVLITGFLATNLGYNKVSYDLSRLLPLGDSTSIVFREFKESSYYVYDDSKLLSMEEEEDVLVREFIRSSQQKLELLLINFKER